MENSECSWARKLCGCPGPRIVASARRRVGPRSGLAAPVEMEAQDFRVLLVREEKMGCSGRAAGRGLEPGWRCTAAGTCAPARSSSSPAPPLPVCQVKSCHTREGVIRCEEGFTCLLHCGRRGGSWREEGSGRLPLGGSALIAGTLPWGSRWARAGAARSGRLCVQSACRGRVSHSQHRVVCLPQPRRRGAGGGCLDQPQNLQSGASGREARPESRGNVLQGASTARHIGGPPARVLEKPFG